MLGSGSRVPGPWLRVWTPGPIQASASLALGGSGCIKAGVVWEYIRIALHQACLLFCVGPLASIFEFESRTLTYSCVRPPFAYSNVSELILGFSFACNPWRWVWFRPPLVKQRVCI